MLVCEYRLGLGETCISSTSKNIISIIAFKIRSHGIHNFGQNYGPVNYDPFDDHLLAMVGASCSGNLRRSAG